MKIYIHTKHNLYRYFAINTYLTNIIRIQRWSPALLGFPWKGSHYDLILVKFRSMTNMPQTYKIINRIAPISI